MGAYLPEIMTSDIFMVNKSISYVSVKLHNLNLYFALDIIFNYISENLVRTNRF